MTRLLLGTAVAVASLASVSAAPAASSYSDRIVGAEFPPITSTLGTFGGVATGALPGAWHVQIDHQPLSTGPSVRITGGTFRMLAVGGRRIVSAVRGGSVSVVDRGAGCTDQTYAIRTVLSVGSFAGTLTHHRRSVFGHCVIYAATITGRASLKA